MRDPARTRALFDRWAATYDADLQTAHGPLSGYQATLETAAQLLPICEHARVLEIGIGTGAFAALRALQGAHITGLDPSPAMLARCRDQHPGFELHSGSFADLSAVSGPFDGIVSTFAWHETPPNERPDSLRAVARMMHSGGVLCFADIIFASSEAVANARRTLARLWDDEERYGLVGELDEQLRGAGLTPLTWRQSGPWHWIVVARGS